MGSARRKRRQEAEDRRDARGVPDVPLPAAPSGPRWSLWTLAAAVVVLAVYAFLRAYALHPTLNDENIYFYLARAWAERGVMPYRDAFLSHPPLQILLVTAVYKVFGYSFAAGKLLTAAASLASGLFVLIAARRRIGPIASVAAALLCLFSYDWLRSASHFTGINESVAFLAAGTWFLVERRDRASGIAFGLAAATGVYTVPTAFVAGVLILLRGLRPAIGFGLGFAAPVVLFNGLFLVLAGPEFIGQVYLYHLAKSASSGEGIRVGKAVLGQNLPLVTAALAGGVAAFLPVIRSWGRGGPREWFWGENSPACTARIAFVLHLVAVLFVASQPRSFNYYWLLAFPPAALAGGYLFERIAARAAAVRTCGASRVWTGLAAAGVIAVIAGQGPIANFMLDVDDDAGDVRAYNWRPSPLPSPIDAAVKAVFWGGDLREMSTEQNAVTRWLWHESRGCDVIDEAAAIVEAGSAPDEGVFGHSHLAPLVALLANRKLAGEVADTNVMRLSAGTLVPSDIIRKIEQDKLRFVISKGGRGLLGTPEFREWLKSGAFPDPRVLTDPYYGDIVLLRRKDR